MSRLNVKRTMIFTLSAALIIYAMRIGISLYSLDAILGMCFVIIVIASLWWKRLYSHPAHGVVLLSAAAAIVFVRSWFRDGPSNRHTVTVGVFFTIFLILSIAMLCTPKPKEK